MAFEAYLKVEGIEGEATQSEHNGWIDILGFSWAASQSAVGQRRAGGPVSGRADISDLVVTKEIDRASPKLASYCCKGAPITKITLHLCEATEKQTLYMEYVLTDALVTSVKVTGKSEDESAETTRKSWGRPTEEVHFNPIKIEWNYTVLDHNTFREIGSVSGHWDRKTNTGG